MPTPPRRATVATQGLAVVSTSRRGGRESGCFGADVERGDDRVQGMVGPAAGNRPLGVRRRPEDEWSKQVYQAPCGFRVVSQR